MGNLNTKQVFDRLKPIVAMMDKTIIAQSVSTLPDGNFLMLCAYTKWLVKGFDVVILGVTYQIVDVDTDVSITLSGASIPGALTFDAYPLRFKHGTIKRVANEQDQIPDPKSRLDLIWLREIVDEGIHFDALDSIDDEAQCRIYFLTACDFQNWTQEDGDVKAIAPMRAACNEFIKVLTNNQWVSEMTSVGRVKNYNIFGNQTDTGATKNIFNEPLSAVELAVTIPFLKECDCCDSAVLDNRPAPGYVLDQNGNILAVLYSNETYTVQAGGGSVSIIDQNDNEIASIQAPGVYQVTVLTEIQDTVDSNTATIIENLT